MSDHEHLRIRRQSVYKGEEWNCRMVSGIVDHTLRHEKSRLNRIVCRWPCHFRMHRESNLYGLSIGETIRVDALEVGAVGADSAAAYCRGRLRGARLCQDREGPGSFLRNPSCLGCSRT